MEILTVFAFWIDTPCQLFSQSLVEFSRVSLKFKSLALKASGKKVGGQGPRTNIAMLGELNAFLMLYVPFF